MTRFLGLIFMLTCGLWQFAYAKNPRIYDDDPTKTSKTMVTLSSGDTTIIVCGTSISLTATGGTTKAKRTV